MWFLIGLFTFACCAAWLAWVRWNVAWSGDRWGVGRFQRRTNKGQLIMLRVGMDTNSELDFEFKREGWYDRLAKRIGIADEPQVGNPVFDDEVYVIADEPRVAAFLAQDQALLLRMRSLVCAATRGFEFRRLVCRRGQLWVMLKPSGGIADESGEINWALAELEALSNALPAVPGYGQRAFDRRFMITAVLFGLSAGLALNAIVQGFRLLMIHFPFTVDDGRLWTLSLLLGAVIVCALLFAALVLLGRSARLHLLMAEILLYGGFGGVGTAFIELRDFNMEVDPGPPTLLSAQVTGKHKHTGKSTRYYLEVSDWNGTGRTQSIQVDYSTYAGFSTGDALQVRQWPGALHVRWVERFEVP